MLGLADYESDEEQARTSPPVKENGSSKEDVKRPVQLEEPIQPVGTVRDGPVAGAAVGPQAISQSAPGDDDLNSTPASPLTAARQLIHGLTLPPVPNVAIPPSPTGSPKRSTATKIGRFLELKAQGVHFNSKLSSSSQLRNPSLLQNLMGFAGIDGEHAQYASTLSPTLAPVPAGGYPAWAYEEELAKTQQDTLKKKEADTNKGKRDVVDFVMATSGPSSQASTPLGGSRLNSKSSAAERVMAGLNRQASRSPHVANDGAQRRSRFDERQGNLRSRSRSPKRRKGR